MVGKNSPLLINEAPLQVLPSLVSALGNINEAIILQQIQYWIKNPKSGRQGSDGRKYIRDTIKEWHQQIPFLSERSIKARLKSLQSKGLIDVANLNASKYDRSLWYTINYDKLNVMVTKQSEATSQSKVKQIHHQKGSSFTIKSEAGCSPIPKTSSKKSSKTSANKHEQSSLTVSQLKDEFEKLWARYPNKKGKKEAFGHYKAWRKEKKSHTFLYLSGKLNDYLNYIQQNQIKPRYIMHGSTWFNGRFDDNLSVDDVNQAPQSGGYSGTQPTSPPDVDTDDLPF